MNGRLVWNQPTCFAWEPVSRTVVKIGAPAAALVGKAPPSIEILFPIQQGVITNQVAATAYLQSLLRVLERRSSGWDMLFSAPSGWAVSHSLTPVQRQLVTNLAHQAGEPRATLVSSLQCIVTALTQPKVPTTRIMLEIGDQLTHFGVTVAGELIVRSVIPWGGRLLTEHVRRLVQEHHHLQLSWQTAESLKCQLGAVTVRPEQLPTERKTVVRGKDTFSQALESTTISNTMLATGFEPLITELLHELKQIWQHIPAELGSTVLETGVYLTGGGAQLTGLKDRLELELQCPVILSEQPQLDVVQGLAQVLSEKENLSTS
jgi:rod shape-determining protein MreB